MRSTLKRMKRIKTYRKKISKIENSNKTYKNKAQRKILKR